MLIEKVVLEETSGYAAILKALHFASIKHKDQRRKDEEASPYINHPIEVAELLARVGHVTGRALDDALEMLKCQGIGPPYALGRKPVLSCLLSLLTST